MSEERPRAYLLLCSFVFLSGCAAAPPQPLTEEQRQRAQDAFECRGASVIPGAITIHQEMNVGKDDSDRAAREERESMKRGFSALGAALRGNEYVGDVGSQIDRGMYVSCLRARGYRVE